MLKSVFKKFLFSYILISVTSLLCVSIALGYYLHGQVYKQKKALLLKEAQKVSDLSNLLIDNEITMEEYMRSLRFIESEEDIRVRLILKRSYEKLPPPFRFRDERIISEDIRNEVFQGKEKFFINNNDENGKASILLGIPFKTEQGIEGGVFLFTPIENTAKKVKEVYKIIAVIFLSIGIPTILVLYFLSKKFTTPLIEMSFVADGLAHGDFNQRVKAKSSDEVGILAASLNNMAKKLQRLEQARRDFIANISHELRTPLTTIMANTQGIMDGVVPKEEVGEYLKVNLEETQRLSLLVDELIELSLIDKGNIKLDIQEVNITELIQNVVKQMEMKVCEKEIKLNIELEDNIKGNIDKNRIKQVIINLLDNAVKYTPEGGEISLSAKAQDGELYIEISDTGCGIPKKHLPMIFERFYKVGKDKGAGIGLSISSQIINAHGGKITVESDEEKGAKFFIKIPV